MPQAEGGLVRALTATLPKPRRHTLDGEAHNVEWEILAPVPREFFAG